ncbi:MAG: reverse transcriptase domain-containing protein [Pseudonocardiaceae bacterium]
MRLNPTLVSLDDLLVAISEDLDLPPRMLPPSVVATALLARRDEVAQWAHRQLSGEFLPTPEETVSVSKARHGVRPVAVWDLPSRLLYRALVGRLQDVLPKVNRGRKQWQAFERLPLEHGGPYVLTADITACYQYVDYGFLSEELLVQGGDPQAVDALIALLSTTSGRSYGLPQQSRTSDALAEAFLDKLERALVRRDLRASRYNDDFRFACRSWSDVVRAIEVLSEEARIMGLTVNDHKTVTWRRARYKAHLDEADALRQEIADEAKLDLTKLDTDDYDDSVVVTPPDERDVDLLASARVLERWESVAGRRGMVPTRRRAEHRAVLELLPLALATLGTEPGTDGEILTTCMRLLRYQQTATPAVGRYLSGRNDEGLVLDAFDGLLRRRAYVNGWQTWWLQQTVARMPGFATGRGSPARLRWARNALGTAEHTPVLRAHAAMTLARHRQIGLDELLGIYARSSTTIRPVLVAAIALLEPGAGVARAVKDDSTLHKWVYDHTASYGRDAAHDGARRGRAPVPRAPR